ncbi:MAG TPA: YtxH domain-containing protein [Gemmatimonadales bacterium]|nr:YtxH domain-containing protein [Gemmatimonadales bacterium]
MTSEDQVDGELNPADDDMLPEDHRGASGMVGFVSGLVLGALIGAGIALLVAPERGAVVRRRLKRRWRQARAETRRGVDRFKRDVEREAARRRRWLRETAEREGA